MKNLLLVFAIISLFSCKKETITPINNDVECVEVSETYKSYKGSIVQFEENNPAIDLEINEIGYISYYRNSKGVYTISSNNLFNGGKTEVYINDNFDTKTNTIIISESVIKIETRDLNGNLQDNLLINTPIEIRIYD